ncbi:MAG: hypothetical protein JNK82_14105 [Myxococcaceae bacterium]|nr:hypothetical protein [Myxococcaceae bacterium]
MRRRLLKLALLVASPLLFYVIVANAFLASGLLTRLTNQNPTKFSMSYGRALTWWPGKVWVRDFRMSYASWSVAFDLELGETRADIHLLELFQRRFHAEDVRSRAVAWRLQKKSEPATFGSLRDAAQPGIAGVVPFVFGPRPEPNAPQKKKKPWSVQLDRVDAVVRELWVLEFRWNGVGRASGDFEVRPMESYWVGPAELRLAPGTVTVGRHEVSKAFGGEAVTVITRTPIVRTEKLRMLGGLNVDGHFHGSIDDLSLARIYGFEGEGQGTLDVEAHVHSGRVSLGTEVNLSLPNVRWVHEKGVGFEGELTAAFEQQRDEPLTLRSSARGHLLVPGPMVANVPELEGFVKLSTNDLTAGPRLASFRLAADEIEVPDAAGVKAALKGRVPFVVPLVLGDGRLTARGLEIRGNTSKVHVELAQASMGVTTARGEVELEHGRATGAVEAHVRALGIGVALEQGEPKFHVFTKRGWLEAQRAERHGRQAPGSR